MKATVISAAILSLAQAQVESLPDYDPASPGPVWWANTGFSFGMLAGFYGPFTQRAQNYGCANESWNVAWSVYGFANYYQQGGKFMSYFDPYDWTELGMRVTTTGYNFWRMYMVCSNEAEVFQSPIFDSTPIGSLLATLPQLEYSQSTSSFAAGFDTMYLMSTVMNLWDAYNFN